MGIVLGEGAHAGKSVQLAALLVAVDSAELGDAQGQILIGTWPPGENLAVVGAVHGLQHVFLILLGSVDGLEAVLAIVSVVARGDIEVLTADMGSDDLLVAKAGLYLAQHVLQAQTQLRSLGQPDGKTLAHALGEEEEIHLLAYLAMVAFLGFLQHDEILIEHLLLGEGDAVDAGHLLALGVSAPESAGHAGNLHGLDDARGNQVRTTAEVGEVALGVSGDGAILQILLYVLALVVLAVGLELLECVGLGDILPHHGLIPLGQLHHLGFYLGKIVLGDDIAGLRHHVIEETILNGGAKTELYARIKLLQSLGQKVSRRVPKGMLALFILKLVELYGGILVDRTVQLYGLAIDPARYNVAGESRRYALSDLQTRDSLLVFANGAVGESDFYHNKLYDYL